MKAEKCKRCYGRGWFITSWKGSETDVDCPSCKGTGKIQVEEGEAK